MAFIRQPCNFPSLKIALTVFTSIISVAILAYAKKSYTFRLMEARLGTYLLMNKKYLSEKNIKLKFIMLIMAKTWDIYTHLDMEYSFTDGPIMARENMWSMASGKGRIMRSPIKICPRPLWRPRILVDKAIMQDFKPFGKIAPKAQDKNPDRA